MTIEMTDSPPVSKNLEGAGYVHGGIIYENRPDVDDVCQRILADLWMQLEGDTKHLLWQKNENMPILLPACNHHEKARSTALAGPTSPTDVSRRSLISVPPSGVALMMVGRLTYTEGVLAKILGLLDAAGMRLAGAKSFSAQQHALAVHRRCNVVRKSFAGDLGAAALQALMIPETSQPPLPVVPVMALIDDIPMNDSALSAPTHGSRSPSGIYAQPLVGQDVHPIAAAFAAHGCDPEEEARAIFKQMDKAGTGRLNAKEVESFLVGMGYTQREAHRFLFAADEDMNGLVDWNEFLEASYLLLDRNSPIFAHPTSTCAKHVSNENLPSVIAKEDLAGMVELASGEEPGPTCAPDSRSIMTNPSPQAHLILEECCDLEGVGIQESMESSMGNNTDNYQPAIGHFDQIVAHQSPHMLPSAPPSQSNSPRRNGVVLAPVRESFPCISVRQSSSRRGLEGGDSCSQTTSTSQVISQSQPVRAEGCSDYHVPEINPEVASSQKHTDGSGRRHVKFRRGQVQDSKELPSIVNRRLARTHAPTIPISDRMLTATHRRQILSAATNGKVCKVEEERVPRSYDFEGEDLPEQTRSFEKDSHALQQSYAQTSPVPLAAPDGASQNSAHTQEYTTCNVPSERQGADKDPERAHAMPRGGGHELHRYGARAKRMAQGFFRRALLQTSPIIHALTDPLQVSQPPCVAKDGGGKSRAEAASVAGTADAVRSKHWDGLPRPDAIAWAYLGMVRPACAAITKPILAHRLPLVLDPSMLHEAVAGDRPGRRRRL